MISKDSYFMRIFFWEWDEARIAPIYIKIPLAILSPSPSMLRLLTALEEFYDTDCYLLIDDICEFPGDQIGIVPFGIATKNAMLITTPINSTEEVLCGVTSVNGEFSLAAIDRTTGVFAALMANQTLVDYLGLVYTEAETNLHQQFLESIGCDDEKEIIYCPTALY